jgi:hypothetical protein
MGSETRPGNPSRWIHWRRLTAQKLLDATLRLIEGVRRRALR